MNLDKRHRTRLIILFIITFIAIILMAISFWNQGRDNDITFRIWPLLYVFLALALISYLIVFARKITNPKLIEDKIQEHVNQERQKILAEFETKEEEVINKSADIDKRVDTIVPKGKFKSGESFANKLLTNLSKELEASIGIFYISKAKKYTFLSGFALPTNEPPADFKSGENLNGEVAKSKQVSIIHDIPEDYFSIESGLGKSKPKTLIIVPVLHKGNAIGIIEIATFITDDDSTMTELLHKVGKTAGEKLMQIQKS